MSEWKLDPAWSIEDLEWELRMIAENQQIESAKYDRLAKDARSVEYSDNWIMSKAMSEKTWNERRTAVEARIAELKGEVQ